MNDFKPVVIQRTGRGYARYYSHGSVKMYTRRSRRDPGRRYCVRVFSTGRTAAAYMSYAELAQWIVDVAAYLRANIPADETWPKASGSEACQLKFREGLGRLVLPP